MASKHLKNVARQIIHIEGLTQSITQIHKWSRLLNALKAIFCTVLLIQNASLLAAEPPFKLPDSGELTQIKSAILVTNKGKLTFELYPEEAPWHVANFKFLADKGFYRGKSFHILLQDFILQTGKNSANLPALRYTLPAEFSQRKHEFGTLGMARAPDAMNPSRASSSTQFHILLTDAKNMDSSYTIFGKLVDGDEVLLNLQQYDKIQELIVYLEDPEPKKEVAQERENPKESWVVSSLRNWAFRLDLPEPKIIQD